MKTTVEEMFEVYAATIPALKNNHRARELAFASFIAGITLSTRVLSNSKSHSYTQKILKGLQVECQAIVVQRMDDILKKGANEN